MNSCRCIVVAFSILAALSLQVSFATISGVKFACPPFRRVSRSSHVPKGSRYKTTFRVSLELTFDN